MSDLIHPDIVPGSHRHGNPTPRAGHVERDRLEVAIVKGKRDRSRLVSCLCFGRAAGTAICLALGQDRD